MTSEEKAEILERFRKEIWPLNKQGNSEHAASEFVYAVSKDVLFEGGPVTLEVIRDKYSEYLRYIRSINSNRSAGFESKVDDLYVFISKKRYNEEFNLDPNSNLDIYFYGE